MIAAALLMMASVDSRAADLRALQRQDQQVADIGYRLASAAVPLCARTARPTLGLTLQWLDDYAPEDRGAAARAYGLGDDPAVRAAAAGSASAEAGVAAGDRLFAIDDVPLPEAHEAVRAALAAAAERGPVRLRVARAGSVREVTLASRPACPARFELVPDGAADARSGDGVVQVTTGLLAEARDRATLAALLAHELAHLLLGHAGMRPHDVDAAQAMEYAADRLSVYLLHAAGFDPQAAVTFWQRRERHAVRDPLTHPPRRTRVLVLQREIAHLQALADAGAPVIPEPDLLSAP